MKKLFLFAFFVSATSFSQNAAADALIQQISNRDAYIVMTKTISPRIHCAAGDAIVRMGKSATAQLISVLTDENKGIAAHFILSEIWAARWEEAVCCEIVTDGTFEIMTVNGLEIFIKENELYAKPEDLKKNQANWKKITHA
jgi:hypothetical protein